MSRGTQVGPATVSSAEIGDLLGCPVAIAEVSNRHNCNKNATFVGSRRHPKLPPAPLVNAARRAPGTLTGQSRCLRAALSRGCGMPSRLESEFRRPRPRAVWL